MKTYRVQLKRNVAILVLLFIVARALPATGCGPFLPYAIFSYTNHPDLPLRNFAAGKLGIVLPTFARSYLFVAYRYLTDRPLIAQEQTAVLGYWHQSLALTPAQVSKNPTQDWLNIRKQVPGSSKPAYTSMYMFTDRTIPGENYQSYTNCLDDAFITATQLLEQKIHKYGTSSPEVKDWLKAQDLVFCHCSNPQYHYQTNTRDPEPPFPTVDPQNSDPIVRAERLYQTACAYFYAQQFDTALDLFNKIAADSNSPYHTIAPYMVVRTLVRKGTLEGTTDKQPFNRDILLKAEAQIKTISNDPKLSAFHKSASKLEQFIRVRLYPEEKLKEVAQGICDESNAQDLQQNLYDFITLMDKELGEDAFTQPTDEERTGPLAKLSNKLGANDLIDWICAFQYTGKQMSAHTWDRWQQTKSLAWLLAVAKDPTLMKEHLGQIEKAVSNVKPDSVAYLSMNYELAQYLVNARDFPKAKELLSRLLKSQNFAQYLSERNLIQDLQAKCPTNMPEFVANAARVPVTVTSNVDGLDLPDEASEIEGLEKAKTKPTPDPAMFNGKSSTLINFNLAMPTIIQLHSDKSFSNLLKGDLTQACWMRAYMLKDQQAVLKLGPELVRYFPEMDPYWQNVVSAKSERERRFAEGYLILKFPRLRPYVTDGLQRTIPSKTIDDYGDNWWQLDAKQMPQVRKFLSSLYLGLVTNTEMNQASAQLTKLKEDVAPATYCGADIISWAKTNHSDSRVPEALHLIVRASHFGKRDDNSTETSKAAFQLLHKNYPNNSYTRITKYWY